MSEGTTAIKAKSFANLPPCSVNIHQGNTKARHISNKTQEQNWKVTSELYNLAVLFLKESVNLICNNNENCRNILESDMKIILQSHCWLANVTFIYLLLQGNVLFIHSLVLNKSCNTFCSNDVLDDLLRKIRQILRQQSRSARVFVPAGNETALNAARLKKHREQIVWIQRACHSFFANSLFFKEKGKNGCALSEHHRASFCYPYPPCTMCAFWHKKDMPQTVSNHSTLFETRMLTHKQF